MGLGVQKRTDVLKLVCLGVAIEASLLILNAATGVDRTSALLEAYYTVPFLAYALAVILAIRGKPGQEGYVEVILVLSFAALFRITFLAQQPTLSGDLYRYLWDGKLINNGISPYAFAPYASQLTSLRDANWLLVQDKDIISPYPPFLELVNALVYRVSPTIVAFKTTFVLFDLASAVALMMVLGRLHLDRRLALIYAWNPLFVLEFGSSGHNDSLAIFTMLLSFYLIIGRRRVSSAAAMALAVLSKLFPVLVVPFFIKRWGAKGTAVLLALVLAAYAPFLYLGNDIYQILSVFVLSNRSLFNGGAFSLLQYAFSGLGPVDAVLAARVIAYSVVGGFILWMTFKVFKGSDDDISIARYSAQAIAIYLALSATLEPWYLAWTFPFLAFLSSDAWLIFSWTVFLTYFTYTQRPLQPGYWAELLWIKLVEYVPLYIMVGYEVVRRRFMIPRKQRLPPA